MADVFGTAKSAAAYYFPGCRESAVRVTMFHSLKGAKMVSSNRRTAHILNDLIKTTHTQHLAGVEWEGKAVSPPVQIPW